MSILARVGRFFPRNTATDAVQTRVVLRASPDAVYRGMLFYEEVPSRPTLFLRAFLPTPVRTQGDKTRPGETIRCTYEGGHLEKRITAVEPARSVRFEVLVQRLGIEDAISMGDGSYEIRAVEGGSEVVLTTRYRGHLRPRWLWRPFERYLARSMHGHILEGMRLVVEQPAAPLALGAPARSGL